MKAEFILTAVHPDQFPDTGFDEIAFLGRSNVGKSSLLNALTGVKGLARTSRTPGRTQAINFFKIEGAPGMGLAGGFSCVLADLPGYGFAKVPAEMKLRWKDLADAYLARTERGVFCLLVDSRRGWMEADLELKEWLEVNDRRFLVVATKFDKLNQKERHAALANLRSGLRSGHVSASYPDSEPVPFSAVTGQGVRELWQAISKTISQ